MKYKLIPMSKRLRLKMELRGECYHEIVEEGDYGGAKCAKCPPYSYFEKTGRSFGWYCPDSPDHQCHYRSEIDGDGNRFVWSINGEKIILIGYENFEHETYDWCIFCGEPEERK